MNKKNKNPCFTCVGVMNCIKCRDEEKVFCCPHFPPKNVFAIKPAEEAKPMKTNIELHKDLCEQLHEIYVAKNHNYGDSFHATFREEGFAMSRIHLSDKLNRFKTLTREDRQDVKDESIRDTLLDLANYAIMTVVEMDRQAEGEEIKPIAVNNIASCSKPPCSEWEKWTSIKPWETKDPWPYPHI